MPKRKAWYERKEYINFKPSTLEEWGQRVWDRFQEELDRRGYDNSMGDNNYLIGMVMMDMTDGFRHTEEESFGLIEQKILDRIDEWEEGNR
jgi:hypothetical protein